MAKLCGPYSSSPIGSYLGDMSPNAFSEEFHQLQPDTFDMVGELPSICGDINKVYSGTFFPNSMDLDLDMKPEVRNTDLMWWTAPPTTSALSTSASSMSSDISTGVSLAAVMGAATTSKMANLRIKTEREETHAPPTVVTAKKITPVSFKQEIVHIKQEPTDDVEQQLLFNNIPNSKTTPTTMTTTSQPQLILENSTSTSMQYIPPGTSLLRKSQQQQQQQKKSQQHIRGTLHITKRGDQLLPSANAINTNPASIDTSSFFNASSPNTSFLYQRPDTPHSLDDDCSTPEFRHNVDLRACVMGSNNISLTTDQDFIKSFTQELQDTSKKQIDTRLISGCSLADVLDVINSSTNSQDFLNFQSTSSALTPPSTENYSDFSYNSAKTNGSMRSFESDSDEESLIESSSCSLLDHDITFNNGSVSPVPSQTSNTGSTQHYMQHRDHSYTRCKDRIDDLSTNLETPSDSEEEIDVVSINDKKLPTNPSDRDRRALQTKVAHKFNAARIVKTPNGIRTIPPRRDSYELPYTPASSSPIKTVNSRFPSPAVTSYQNQYTTKYVQHQQQMMTVVKNDSSTVLPITIQNTADKMRKRFVSNGGGNANDMCDGASITSVVNITTNKKQRGKKTKLVTAVQLSNGILKRHYSIDETADTIEKRNLHNDMERQRRIGLKNLFEALKKQIPSIRDKERAPKVNILREAAKLCEALTREDQQLMEQKVKLKEELKRKQQLLAQLKAAQQQD